MEKHTVWLVILELSRENSESLVTWFAFGDMVTVTHIASQCCFLFNSFVSFAFQWFMYFFSLKTLEEFRKVMIEIPVPTVKKGKSVQKRLSVNLPKFINWKKRGYVTPVRTQVWLCHVPILVSHWGNCEGARLCVEWVQLWNFYSSCVFIQGI